MKRRRRQSDGSLDSLLDTMTNVVGILVIVLVVTQLGVGDAVKRISRIEGPLAELTPEDVELAEWEAENAGRQLEALKEKHGGLDVQVSVDETTLQLDRQSVERVREELKKAQAGQLKPDELKKQIDQRQKRAKELEEQIAKADAELARLKALLDRGKQPGVAADSVIRLPNPRRAPKGIVPVVFACRHGRVMPADDAELVKLAMKEIALLQRGKKELDSKTLTGLFNRKTIGTTYFRLRFRVIGGYPYLIVEHNPNTGTPTASLVKGPSLFRDRVNRLNKARQYARFLVWGDSFDTYLAARNLADRRGLLAGWEPYDVNHEWRISLRGKVTLADVKPPVVKKPPPSKKPPAKPKEKPRPPLPTEQID